ncbi:MAG: hypothetical protein WD512_14585 [Candidatus Paceibacterota bacterium]
MSEKVSPIDEKKNQQSTEPKENINWSGFLIQVLVNVIIVLLWGIIGSNFVYFMHTNLDSWFPDNPNLPPYMERKSGTSFISSIKNAAKTLRKSFSGGKYIDGCTPVYETAQATAKIMEIKDKLGMNKLSTPYDGISDDFGINTLFSNMFGSSARYSYVMGRRLLKLFFRSLQEMGGRGETLIFAFVPLILFAMLFQVPFFFGFATTLWGEITSSSYGWFWTWIFLFVFGISLLWPLAVGVAQSIQFFVTMLLLPMYADFDMIKEILACNSHLLGGLFGLLTIVAASANLNGLLTAVTAVMMIFLWYKRK